MKIKNTILIIEDEKSLRSAVVDILRLKGFIPLEARNGKEGVRLALLKRPDCILLDLIMPEMDGVTALKKIRESKWGKNVPVIILTNLSNGFVDEPTTHYLIKSDWKLHDIVRKIEEVLER